MKTGITGSAKLLLMGVILLIGTKGYGQSLNNNWKQEVAASLEEFLKCKEGSTEPTQCNSFTGESLNRIYKVNDFYSQKASRYMMPTEISGFVKESEKWTLLGHSYEQTALAAAQEYANAKKAVVAIYTNAAGVGHVAIITPGQLRPSGTWGLSVPSAVSFFTMEPAKSFVDKSLSYAFAKNMQKDVLIYGRKY